MLALSTSLLDMEEFLLTSQNILNAKYIIVERYAFSIDKYSDISFKIILYFKRMRLLVTTFLRGAVLNNDISKVRCFEWLYL